MRFEISSTTQQQLTALCRKYHVQRLSVFGSMLRGEERPDSDLDVLVEFLPGHVPGFFTFVDLKDDLSTILERQVDLRTPEDLSKYFRATVVKEAHSIYAAH